MQQRLYLEGGGDEAIYGRVGAKGGWLCATCWYTQREGERYAGGQTLFYVLMGNLYKEFESRRFSP